MELFGELDKYMIAKEIFGYLDYDESKELSKVNKEFRELYKRALRTGVIHRYSRGDIFMKNNVIGTPIYSKYTGISYNRNRVYYQYIGTGSFNNVYWPITNRRVQLMSRYITYQNLVLEQSEEINKFRKDWKRVKDNSDYVYTVKYLHPLMQQNFYVSFKFMFVLFYITVLFMSLLFSIMFVSVLYSDIFMIQMQNLENMMNYPIYLNMPNEIRIPLYYNKNIQIDYEHNIFIDNDRGIEFKFDNITFEYYFENDEKPFYSNEYYK